MRRPVHRLHQRPEADGAGQRRHTVQVDDAADHQPMGHDGGERRRGKHQQRLACEQQRKGPPRRIDHEQAEHEGVRANRVLLVVEGHAAGKGVQDRAGPIVHGAVSSRPRWIVDEVVLLQVAEGCADPRQTPVVRHVAHVRVVQGFIGHGAPQGQQKQVRAGQQHVQRQGHCQGPARRVPVIPLMGLRGRQLQGHHRTQVTRAAPTTQARKDSWPAKLNPQIAVSRHPSRPRRRNSLRAQGAPRAWAQAVPAGGGPWRKPKGRVSTLRS